VKQPATLSGKNSELFYYVFQELNSVDEDTEFWDMALRD